MKRSKIFLAGTTCLLAIAGVAATNAHKGTKVHVYYTSTNLSCTSFKNTSCSINGTGGICRTGSTGSKTLFTTNNPGGFCPTARIARYHNN